MCSLNIFSLIASRSCFTSALSSLRRSVLVYLEVFFSFHPTCCLPSLFASIASLPGFPRGRCWLLFQVDTKGRIVCPEGGNGPGRPGFRAIALGKLLSVFLSLSSCTCQIPGKLPPSCLGAGTDLAASYSTNAHSPASFLSILTRSTAPNGLYQGPSFTFSGK